MIRIANHIEELVDVDNDTYVNMLNRLSHALSHDQPYPFSFFAQASIRNAAIPLSIDPARVEKLRYLANFNLSDVAKESCERVSTLLPPAFQDIEVHVFPAIAGFGGGCTIAPGKILVSVICDDLPDMRLKRNIAHEYSHSIRMTQKPQATQHGFGEAVPYSVRDYLIFEGLAMTLSDTLFPAPIPVHSVTEDDEAAWWNKAKLDALGSQAYVDQIGLNAYEIGRRIVQAYLEYHEISILEAHHLSDDDLYWNSGYPHIR